MKQKSIIIICATLIVIVAIICGTVYLTSVKDTNLSISSTKVTQGDNITITLVDENSNPLVNKNITINMGNDKNKSKVYNLTTDNKGIAYLKVESIGNFTINVTFEGELLLKPCNLTKTLTVNEKVVAKPTRTYSYHESNADKYKRAGSMSKSEFYSTIVIHTADGGADVMQEDGSYKHYS